MDCCIQTWWTSIFDQERRCPPIDICDVKTNQLAKIIRKVIQSQPVFVALNLRAYFKERFIPSKRLVFQVRAHFLTGDDATSAQLLEEKLALLNKVGNDFLNDTVTIDEMPLSLISPESKPKNME